jgi:hypothetical protein
MLLFDDALVEEAAPTKGDSALGAEASEHVGGRVVEEHDPVEIYDYTGVCSLRGVLAELLDEEAVLAADLAFEANDVAVRAVVLCDSGCHGTSADGKRDATIDARCQLGKPEGFASGSMRLLEFPNAESVRSEVHAARMAAWSAQASHSPMAHSRGVR